MNTVDVNGLRILIKGLPSDNKRLEREELRALIQCLADDLREAQGRGVMLKTLAEIISEKAGARVTREFLSDTIKAPEPPKRKECAHPPPKSTDVTEARPRLKDNRRKSKNKNFIIAAITPDGELYQIGNSQIKGRCLYVTCQVDENGIMHPRTGTEFPVPNADRDTAVGNFRDWGRGKGYEVFEG
jgi:hypothetical protein